MRSRLAALSAQTLKQVVADTQCVGHDRQRRIDGTGRGKERAINDIKIVKIVRLAVDVQHAGCGFVAETECAVLVADAGDAESRSQEVRTGAAVPKFGCGQHVLELCLKPVVRLGVVVRV